MRADAMLAEFRKAGGRYKILENSQTRAAAEFTFEGQVLAFEFSIEDARRTGDCLAGDGRVKTIWQKRPEDMLWARMVSRAVRRLCPEINAGVYAPEEVSDFGGATQRGAAPITKAEAARRATTVKPEFEVAPESGYDPGVCPIGGEEYEGLAWTAFASDQLRAALESDAPEITPTHRAEINLVLDARGENEVAS
jgi:hypothetical protein